MVVCGRQFVDFDVFVVVGLLQFVWGPEDLTMHLGKRCIMQCAFESGTTFLVAAVSF